MRLREVGLQLGFRTDPFFGTQGDGTLRWGRKGTGAPKGWKTGKTYAFTVDLCKGTYTLTEQ